MVIVDRLMQSRHTSNRQFVNPERFFRPLHLRSLSIELLPANFCHLRSSEKKFIIVIYDRLGFRQSSERNYDTSMEQRFSICILVIRVVDLGLSLQKKTVGYGKPLLTFPNHYHVFRRRIQPASLNNTDRAFDKTRRTTGLKSYKFENMSP